MLFSGLLGLVVYLAVNGLGTLFENPEARPTRSRRTSTTTPPAAKSGVTKLARATGKAGFFLFLYLEVLDASFSFDGVIGAFAITSDPIIIALGLGLIGAMFVRSLTVYLVRQGTLSEYVYLEHGAHWAIGALAVILLISIGVHINEFITGLIGVAFIGASFLTSIRRNRRLAAKGEEVGTVHAESRPGHPAPPRSTEGTAPPHGDRLHQTAQHATRSAPPPPHRRPPRPRSARRTRRRQGLADQGRSPGLADQVGRGRRHRQGQPQLVGDVADAAAPATGGASWPR